MRKPVRIDRPSAGKRAPTKPVPSRPVPAASPQQNSALGPGCGVVILIVFILFMISRCSSTSVDAPANTAQAAASEPAYVAARSLNCRQEPDASAPVAEGLSRDDQVVVSERRGDWARLARPSGDCWVSNAFLADALGENTIDAAVNAETPSNSEARGLVSSGAGAAVAAAGTGYVAAKAARSAKRYKGARHRSTRKRRSSGGGYFGSDCPCSGSRICIGPRGGRYCITSGGNKRYGV